ncbi:MAG: PKD domain-containing protein [Bacteroidales bacterium]|nr:PKD domain-containing protein [Bacteroidales bacterium]
MKFLFCFIVILLGLFNQSVAQFGYEFWSQIDCIVRIDELGNIKIFPSISNINRGFVIGNYKGEVEVCGSLGGIWNGDFVQIKKCDAKHSYICIAQDPINPNLFYKFEACINGHRYFVLYTQFDLSKSEKVVKEQVLQEKFFNFIHIVPSDKNTLWVLANTKGTQDIMVYELSEGNLVLKNRYDVGFTFPFTFNVMKSFDNPQHSKIYLNQASGLLVMDFDVKTGYISNFQTYSEIKNAAISPSGKYIYTINVSSDKILSLYRYESDNLLVDGEVVFSSPVSENELLEGVNDIILGPDGNLYIARAKKYLDIVTDVDSPSPKYFIDKIFLENGTSTLFPDYVFNPSNIRVDFSCNTVFFLCPLFNNITSCSWNFGDGSQSTDINPTHIYNTSGLYEVKLNVVLDDGIEKKYSKKIRIPSPPKKPVIILSD